MMKNTISSKVSETAPLIGQTSSTRPAAMASTAESSDHQKPGAWRAQKVVTRPDDAADQEQPAQENRDGDGGERRHHDRQEAEHDEDDSLDQEQAQCSRIDCASARCSD